jgi:hypothetical protein
LLNDQWVIQEMGGNQVSWKLMKMETPLTRTYGIHERQSWEESL